MLGGVSQTAEAKPGPSRRAPRAGGARTARTVIAVALVVLASTLAALSVVSRYAHAVIADEERYLAMVGPLAEHPEIQQQVVDSVTDAVVASVPLTELSDAALLALLGPDTPLGRLLAQDPRVAEALRTTLSRIAPALQDQLENTTRAQTERIVRSPEFAGLWIEVNRSAHRALVSGLTGGGEVVGTDGGELTVDLGAVVEAAKQRMLGEDFPLAERIPAVEARVVVLRSDALATAQQAFRLLEGIATWSWWVALLVGVAALVVAPARRLIAAGLGAGVAAAMAMLAVALALARAWVVDAVSATAIRPAAAAVVLDAVMDPLYLALRSVLVVGLVVLAGALLAGPLGGRLRTGLGRTRQAAYGSRPVPAWQAWCYRHRVGLRLAVLVLAVFALAFWPRPDAAVLLGVGIAAALLLLGVELLGRPPVGIG